MLNKVHAVYVLYLQYRSAKAATLQRSLAIATNQIPIRIIKKANSDGKSDLEDKIE